MFLSLSKSHLIELSLKCASKKRKVQQLRSGNQRTAKPIAIWATVAPSTGTTKPENVTSTTKPVEIDDSNSGFSLHLDVDVESQSGGRAPNKTQYNRFTSVV